MKISIIIPVYQVAPYIADCLQSVMRQTYTGEMECLLVDDCGTDESIPIAERMIAEYKGPIRFEILHHEHHRGLSAARNTGTLCAKGEYVYYIDGDDFIADDCIEKMMTLALSDPDIELVQGNHCLCGEEQSFPMIARPLVTHAATNQAVRKSLNKQLISNAWNKLIKKSMLLQHRIFFKEGTLYEDLLWRFYLMKYIQNAYFLPDVTYCYRRRPGSIMTGTDKNTAAYHHSIVYQDIITHLTPGHEKEELSFYANSVSSYYLRHARHSKEMKEVFLTYWEKAWELKCLSLFMLLSLCYVLGFLKYGWVLLALLVRLKHPRLIPNDFRRLWGNIKPQMFSQA